jgi:hypothetical protein
MSHISVSKRTTLTDDNRHRLQLWVSETTNNIPASIFVYQRIPTVPLSSALSTIFVHIASYADLAEFPEDTPDSTSPFFRRRSVDLVFDSLPYLNDTYKRIILMVRQLVEDVGRLNDWDPAEIREIPVP